MLLCGNLAAADQLKKVNAQAEKSDLQRRQREMSEHFGKARANLLEKQRFELERLRMIHDGDAQIFNERERRDMLVKTRRLEATQAILVDEKDFGRFIAKKTKRNSMTIVPSTVMTIRDAPEDLPVIPRGKTVPAGMAEMSELRKKIVVTRLPLLPLAIRHYKGPPLDKPKAKSSD
jgi:hypothetical protein